MNEDRFEAAARAYLVYGVVYWLGGAWLAWNGIGTRAGRAVVWQGVAWVAVGLALVLLIPYLLWGRRRWFERWLLSRRDFARILALFMGLRALAVLRVAIRSETASVAAPWGGVVTFRMGATVFFLVTVVALVFVARAAWSEPKPGRPAPGSPTPGNPDPPPGEPAPGERAPGERAPAERASEARAAGRARGSELLLLKTAYPRLEPASRVPLAPGQARSALQ